jgi:hypothetical protein
MIFQASGRSAFVAATLLVAASVLSLAGTGPSFATAAAGGLQVAAADVAAEGTATTMDRSVDPAQGAATMAAETQPAPDGQAADATTETTPAQHVSAVSNDDSSGWDKASIIGKIFIACGTLLTLGSAARMFMI